MPPSSPSRRQIKREKLITILPKFEINNNITNCQDSSLLICDNNDIDKIFITSYHPTHSPTKSPTIQTPTIHTINTTYSLLQTIKINITETIQIRESTKYAESAESEESIDIYTYKSNSNNLNNDNLLFIIILSIGGLILIILTIILFIYIIIWMKKNNKNNKNKRHHNKKQLTNGHITYEIGMIHSFCVHCTNTKIK